MTAFVAGATNHIPLLNQLATRNLIINGDFRVNQRVYVSAAVLASGAYGHDRWKGGAAGGDYSFTQLPHSTQIQIAANKTLIQVIEDKMVEGGQYVLSWEGTCQARYGLNSATPSGSYASSPIIISGQTAGTTMSVEFGNGASAGTLGKVHLELATADASDFHARPFGEELRLCQRYYQKSFAYATVPAQNAGTVGAVRMNITGTSITAITVQLLVAMRTAPTVTTYNPSAANAQVRNVTDAADCSGTGASEATESTFLLAATANAGGSTGDFGAVHWSAVAEL